MEYQIVPSGARLAGTLASTFGYEAKKDLKLGYKDFMQLINDVLHGRAQPEGANRLEAWIKNSPQRQWFIGESITRFIEVKKQIGAEYRKTSEHRPDYHYTSYRDARLKIIDQSKYDIAFQKGFPKDFFANSYLRGVNIYCLPENADFSNSFLLDCNIAVCGARNANFSNATMQTSSFGTVDLTGATFDGATIAWARFNDCQLDSSTFIGATFERGHMTDCCLSNTTMKDAKITGTYFTRIDASGIAGMETVKVEMASAPANQVAEYRLQVAAALSPPEEAPTFTSLADRLQAAKAKASTAKNTTAPDKEKQESR